LCETEFAVHTTVTYNFTDMWTWKYVLFNHFVLSRKVQRNEEINEVGVPSTEENLE
jgi:hypothetical protein